MRRRDAPQTSRKASSQSVALGYASEEFKAFCEAVGDLDALRRSGHWGRLLVAAGRHSHALWRGFRGVRRLERLELPLTDGPPGRAIQGSVRRRTARVARAVLRLPEDRAQYLRGRSKQALRTNVRHAEGLGIRCQRLPEATQQSEAIDAFLLNVGGGDSDRGYLERIIGLEPGRQEFHAALDAQGRVIALAALDVDARCARLVFLRSIGDAPGGPARYALMRHVIDDLIDRKVRMLLVGGAVRLAPGLQYFQRRLGFELFNVHPLAAEGHEAHAPALASAPDVSRPLGSSRSRSVWPATR